MCGCVCVCVCMYVCIMYKYDCENNYCNILFETEAKIYDTCLLFERNRGIKICLSSDMVSRAAY